MSIDSYANSRRSSHSPPAFSTFTFYLELTVKIWAFEHMKFQFLSLTFCYSFFPFRFVLLQFCVERWRVNSASHSVWSGGLTSIMWILSLSEGQITRASEQQKNKMYKHFVRNEWKEPTQVKISSNDVRTKRKNDIAHINPIRCSSRSSQQAQAVKNKKEPRTVQMQIYEN